MELNRAVENSKADDQPSGIGIEVESDPTLGYASIQNSVPVIRSLRLTNHDEKAQEGLDVRISCNPGFAKGAKLRFERLGPGETRIVAPIELQPDHAYLADLQEAVIVVSTLPFRVPVRVWSFIAPCCPSRLKLQMYALPGSGILSTIWSSLLKGDAPCLHKACPLAWNQIAHSRSR